LSPGLTSGFNLIFGILAHSQSDIKYTVQREFYYKAVLSGHYYSTSFKIHTAGSAKDVYILIIVQSITVIHILIGIIPVHVPFVLILPLIEIARTQIL